MEISNHGFNHPEMIAWQDKQVGRSGKLSYQLARPGKTSGCFKGAHAGRADRHDLCPGGMG